MAVFSVIIYAVILVFAEPAAAIFNSEKDPELQAIARAGSQDIFYGRHVRRL